MFSRNLIVDTETCLGVSICFGEMAKSTSLMVMSSTSQYTCPSAEYQKAREEKQAAVQAAGKRSRIDFTSSSQSAGSSSQHRGVGHPSQSALLRGGPKSGKNRFAPHSGLHSQPGSNRPNSRYG